MTFEIVCERLCQALDQVGDLPVSVLSINQVVEKPSETTQIELSPDLSFNSSLFDDILSCLQQRESCRSKFFAQNKALNAVLKVGFINAISDKEKPSISIWPEPLFISRDGAEFAVILIYCGGHFENKEAVKKSALNLAFSYFVSDVLVCSGDNSDKSDVDNVDFDFIKSAVQLSEDFSTSDSDSDSFEMIEDTFPKLIFLKPNLNRCSECDAIEDNIEDNNEESSFQDLNTIDETLTQYFTKVEVAARSDLFAKLASLDYFEKRKSNGEELRNRFIKLSEVSKGHQDMSNSELDNLLNVIEVRKVKNDCLNQFKLDFAHFTDYGGIFPVWEEKLNNFNEKLISKFTEKFDLEVEIKNEVTKKYREKLQVEMSSYFEKLKERNLSACNKEYQKRIDLIEFVFNDCLNHLVQDKKELTSEDDKKVKALLEWPDKQFKALALVGNDKLNGEFCHSLQKSIHATLEEHHLLNHSRFKDYFFAVGKTAVSFVPFVGAVSHFHDCVESFRDGHYLAGTVEAGIGAGCLAFDVTTGGLRGLEVSAAITAAKASFQAGSNLLGRFWDGSEKNESENSTNTELISTSNTNECVSLETLLNGTTFSISALAKYEAETKL